MSNVIEPENPLTPPTTYNPEPQPWTIGLASATSGIRATLVHDVDNQIGNKFFGDLGIGWANDQSKRRYGHAQSPGEFPSVWETWNFYPLHKPKFNYFFFPNQAQRFGELFVLVDGDTNFVNSASRDQEWILTFSNGRKIRLFAIARWVINEPLSKGHNDPTRLYVLHLVDGRYFLPKTWSIGGGSSLSISNSFISLNVTKPTLYGGVLSDLPPVGLLYDWMAFQYGNAPKAAWNTSTQGTISFPTLGSVSEPSFRARNERGFDSLERFLGGFDMLADRNKMADQSGSAAAESLQIGGTSTSPFNVFRFLVGLQRYGMHVGVWAVDMNGSGVIVSGATPTRVIPVWISINVNTTTVPTTHSAMVAAASNWTTVNAILTRLAKMYQAAQGYSSRGTIRALWPNMDVFDSYEHECRYVELVDHPIVMNNFELTTQIPYKSDYLPWQVPYVASFGGLQDYGQQTLGLFKWVAADNKWRYQGARPSLGATVNSAYPNGLTTPDWPAGLTAGGSFTVSGSPFSYTQSSLTNNMQMKFMRVNSPTRIYNDGSTISDWFDQASDWSFVCVYP